MRLSVCVPMYNEAAIAAGTAAEYSAACAKLAGDDWELIFCDDGSTDGCGDIVRALGIPNVRVVGYAKNRGKGCAVRTAILASRGDIIVCTDCDNAYGTDRIAEAVGIFDSDPDADVVIGSRTIGRDGYEGYSFHRKLMSKIYILVIKLAAGFRHSDSQCGFKAYRGEAGRRIFSKCETDGWAFDIEALMIAEKMGYKIREMAVKIINHRESKVSPLRDAVRMLRDLRKIKKRLNAASYS